MKDNVLPDGKWEFNSEVAACFANMLERSIPDYKSMRALSYKAGEKFIQPDTLIVDAGCSTGLAVEPFVVKYCDQNDFLLVDNAPAMVEACRETGSVYLCTVGGVAALLAKAVVASEMVGWDDLGTEALRRLTLVDFPCYVAVDACGRDLYREIEAAASSMA